MSIKPVGAIAVLGIIITAVLEMSMHDVVAWLPSNDRQRALYRSNCYSVPYVTFSIEQTAANGKRLCAIYMHSLNKASARHVAQTAS